MGVHIAVIATKDGVENLIWYIKGINERDSLFPDDLEQCIQLLPDKRDLVTGHVTSLWGKWERKGGGRSAENLLKNRLSMYASTVSVTIG